jgi:hypothetical protein
MVPGRAAASDDLESVLVQALANGGSDATHATGHVRYFLAHCFLLFGFYRQKTELPLDGECDTHATTNT